MAKNTALSYGLTTVTLERLITNSHRYIGKPFETIVRKE